MIAILKMNKKTKKWKNIIGLRYQCLNQTTGRSILI